MIVQLYTVKNPSVSGRHPIRKVSNDTAPSPMTPDEAQPYGGSDAVRTSRQGQRAVPSPATGCAAQSATIQAASPRAQGRVRGSIHAAERRTGGRAAVLILWEIAGGSPAAHCRTDGLHLR